jgi:hypothetical protein
MPQRKFLEIMAKNTAISCILDHIIILNLYLFLNIKKSSRKHTKVYKKHPKLLKSVEKAIESGRR